MGVEVAKSSPGINLCQRKYVTDLVTETRMLGAKPIDTLMESNSKLLSN